MLNIPRHFGPGRGGIEREAGYGETNVSWAEIVAMGADRDARAGAAGRVVGGPPTARLPIHAWLGLATRWPGGPTVRAPVRSPLFRRQHDAIRRRASRAR